MSNDTEDEDLHRYLSQINLLRDSLSNTPDNFEIIQDLDEQAQTLRRKIKRGRVSDTFESEVKRRKRQEEEDAAFAARLLEELDSLEDEERRLEQIRCDEEFARSLVDQEIVPPESHSPKIQTTLGAELSIERPKHPPGNTCFSLVEIDDITSKSDPTSSVIQEEPPWVSNLRPSKETYLDKPTYTESIRLKRELPWISDRSKISLGSSPSHPISLDDSSDDDTPHSPFIGLSSMAQSYYNMYLYDRQDSSQTKEDLKNLLMNIRPDQELPAHLREGTPSGLSDRIALMEHQKLGLAWLKKMEEGSNHGGILADDMGLGKTIQSLALIVSKKSENYCQKSNLIVAPVALLHQWAREIKSKTSPPLKVYIHHSTHKKHFTATELLFYDVVLTTFHTLAYEFKMIENHKKLREENPMLPERPPIPCPFTEATWYRIILDEAQMIKNHNTQSAKACFTLKAKYRWCLSGTPMQNNVDELYSLLKFLRIRPYNNLSLFNSSFSAPLKSGRQSSISNAMKKLQALLKAILLRRTKESRIDGRPILTLPPKTIKQVHAVFSPDEDSFYHQLESSSVLQMNQYVKAGTVGSNYSNILVLLLRLRQACCHPFLIRNVQSRLDSLEKQDIVAHLSNDVIDRIRNLTTFDCSICFDLADNPSCLECGHYYCADCLLSLATQAQTMNIEAGQESSQGKCPQCRGPLDMKRVFSLKEFYKAHAPEKLKTEPEYDRIFLDPKGKGKAVETYQSDELLNGQKYIPSAKIEKTMDILQTIRKTNPKIKTLIFSQFTSLLDILEHPLREANFKFGRYDGSLSASARNQAVVSFQDDPSITILLVSLKAGNVGLNLTAATQVIIFDPYWNPSTENQAIDRAYRIGQNFPLTVHKLVIKGTIEDRVLALQEKKRELIEGALNDDATRAIARLTQRDLLFLFGLEER